MYPCVPSPGFGSVQGLQFRVTEVFVPFAVAERDGELQEGWRRLLQKREFSVGLAVVLLGRPRVKSPAAPLVWVHMFPVCGPVVPYSVMLFPGQTITVSSTIVA